MIDGRVVASGEAPKSLSRSHPIRFIVARPRSPAIHSREQPPQTETRTTGDVRESVDPGMTTLALPAVMVMCMTEITRWRPAFARRMSTATKVNALAMVAAIGAIIWQVAAGVDYPTVPPGPIILGVAVVVVVFVQALWAGVVGVVVPLFLLIGGTIAGITDADNPIRDPGAASPFAAIVLQLAALIVAVIAGVVALRERRS